MFLFLEVLCLVLIAQTIGFALAIVLKRNSLADVLWGLVIAISTYYCATRLDFRALQTTIIASFMMLWGARLSLHIGVRFIRKKAEDPRYKALSKNWHNYYLQSYLRVFLLQGALMTVMLTGLITTIIYPQVPHFYFFYLGAAVASLGLTIEIIADWQLGRFVKNKKPGQIMQKGLWRYSRHPNYFGEVTFWWGLFLITLPTPYWYITIIPPILITFLILKVSGVPMAEARYKDNQAFKDYAKRTNAFFPWWPKKNQDRSF